MMRYDPVMVEWTRAQLERRGLRLEDEHIYRLVRVGPWCLACRFADPIRLAFWYRFLYLGPAIARRAPLVLRGWWGRSVGEEA